MEPAFYILLLAGNLGFLDILYFHTYRCRLMRRSECQREVLFHTLRHSVYAVQFIIIANIRFHGWTLLILAFLYACDVAIAWADVLEEPTSRAAQGGLPRGEYFMHIVLSLLVGAYLFAVAETVWPDRLLPTAVVVDPPHVPSLLRLMMTGMGFAAFGYFCHDMYGLLTFRSPGSETTTDPLRG
jgi:hypothetical protein